MKTMLFIMLFFQMSFAQGKLAAEFKDIIGFKFISEKHIPQLENYRYIGGSIISDLEFLDSFFLSLEVFRNGTTAIVLLCKQIDKTNNQKRIIEVLKIIDVPANYEIRISSCTSININPDAKIVAVYYIGRKKNVKLIKEAFVLKDIRFEKMNAKSVKCINEI